MEIGMNAIVTVIGKDKVGIIAAVCIKLAEMNVNVLDISQTILDGKFTMVMAVDAANANVGFEELAAQLRELGEGMELSIRIQREEIFDAMHRI
jgi:ACT domain-containing protein